MDLQLIHSEKLNESNVEELLGSMDGLLIAPGFGQRGIEGKFTAIKYAREHDVPTFGICLGMQCMEVSTKHNVIDLMESQKSVSNMGGTMRLGEYDCVLDPDSKTAKAYQSTHIKERHRHRFEFNSDYRAEFEAAGMKCVGENPETHLVEVVEIPSLSWFIGVQYHPEYNSTVLRPNHLFIDFIKAVIKNKK